MVRLLSRDAVGLFGYQNVIGRVLSVLCVVVVVALLCCVSNFLLLCDTLGSPRNTSLYKILPTLIRPSHCVSVCMVC